MANVKIDLKRDVYDFESKLIKAGEQSLPEKLAKNLINRGAAIAIVDSGKVTVETKK